MKTKLLRKVRKRFEINYYPNGYSFGGDRWETSMPCVVLIDNYTFFTSPIRHVASVNISKQNGYWECYNALKEIILNTYWEKGTRRNKKLEKIEEKLWYGTK